MSEKSNSDSDFLKRIQYIGYCMSQMPPQGVDMEWEDFIIYAKFQLCRINKVLVKDPIWDTYKDAEILTEYYAHLYYNEPEKRDKFISELNGVSEDVYDWLDSQIEKNQKEMQKDEESLSFNPDTLGD